MNTYRLDLEKYAATAREAVAESCVMLKNENQTLPLRAGEKVSLFGRIQLDYFKSGTGSGGLVNTKYVVSILDALKACPNISLDTELLCIYETWVAAHPFDHGKGWAQEPWSQAEMPLNERVVATSAERSDVALVIVGRTAGEDRDNKAEPGSYLLTADEEDMIEKVCRHFRRVAVVLNVGNIMDMKWVEAHQVPAVLIAWQGGMEGGNGVVDILTGRTSPSGKLPDTISRKIEDYPSSAEFGGKKRAIYVEDIYVGYRYFETAAKERVLYPFGFGLSYTSFSMEQIGFKAENEKVDIRIQVTNTGKTSGKEVVQIYVEAPQGSLGKAARSLIAFAKTGLLAPGTSEELVFTIPRRDMASYDDSGCTGHKACYMLEAGDYHVYMGSDVRSAAPVGRFFLSETLVTEELEEAAAPVRSFKRLKPRQTASGCVMVDEKVPGRTVDPLERIQANRPSQIPQTGDQGIRLVDVLDKKAGLDDFIAQLSDEDLACMVRGEGMCSPKVTPGTASAFGGVTESLARFGIPVGCCADGPSGIRMDCGTHAFSLPNGTALASTFNTELVEKLFDHVGLELRRNRVDTMLGPGMNIHRNPLNGRNFEYFSEDPLLTAKMAVAQLHGMHRHGVIGTVKHFAGNNQEFHRHDIDSVISERALREIYLKGFEMAVREGKTFSVMSTYGGLNGVWTAGNYDLLTTILREEWGFDGIVMTDWWAKMNDEGKPARRNNTAAMIRAQNDLYMVVTDAASNSSEDNTLEGLESGAITRGELQRCAANILKALMRLPVMERYLNRSPVEEQEAWATEEATGEERPPFDLPFHEILDEKVLDLSDMDTSKGASNLLGLSFTKRGFYTLELQMRSDAGELAQIPMSLFVNNVLAKTVTISGTKGQWVKESIPLGPFFTPHVFLKLNFSQSGMELGPMKLTFTKPMKWGGL